MATNFPTSLDALSNPTSSNKLNDAGVLHADQHGNANDAIEALQAKVGINGSAVTTSLDYKVTQLAPKASPTFTGTVTLPLTTAGYVTTTSGGIIGSVATIPNAGLTNSSITVNGTAISLGASGTVTVPISTGVSGLGTGIATFLATPSSANLASALTNETGDTFVVFSNNPTLTGAITATSATLARGYVTGSATTYSVLATDTHINWAATATTSFTLPTATLGRELYIKNTTAFAINSASSNVLPLGSSTPGNAILAATAGKFALLVGNGTNWVVMMAN